MPWEGAEVWLVCNELNPGVQACTTLHSLGIRGEIKEHGVLVCDVSNVIECYQCFEGTH
jgi:hypothetical protein